MIEDKEFGALNKLFKVTASSNGSEFDKMKFIFKKIIFHRDYELLVSIVENNLDKSHFDIEEAIKSSDIKSIVKVLIKKIVFFNNLLKIIIKLKRVIQDSRSYTIQWIIILILLLKR